MGKVDTWPIYFRDKLVIGSLDSGVGVATLWMPKESVVEELPTGSFAVCGQLYTKRGISPMLRNILANPKIRNLVICGVDRQGSGDALLKFFKNGVEKENDKSGRVSGWKIKGDNEALIDKQISLSALKLVRENVEVFDMRMEPLKRVGEKVFSLSAKKPQPFAKPQTFEETPIPKINNYPSDLSVFKIKNDYIADAWLDVLKNVMRFGVEVEGLYGKVKLIHNLTVVIEKEDPASPKLSSFLKFNDEGLNNYMRGFFDTSKGSESYTYGERLFDWDGINQIKIMSDKLKGFPYDRGALAVLWKPHLDNFPPKDTKTEVGKQTKGWQVPCLVLVLGQCIGGDLNMTAVFRSNDMYGAWPLNAFALRKLQGDIAKKIKKSVGSLTTISHVAEVYEIDWNDANEIIKDNDDLSKTCVYDTRSYYTIDVEGKEIVLKFFSPDGAILLCEFRGDGKKPKAARDLCALVLRDLLISELGAAMDLGRQLAKAETAIKLGLQFKQDNELVK